MKSREHFILQVKKKIIKEHAQEDKASFIFGLSGKWGEGKTKFLEGLEVKLEKAGFEKPIWVSPWKYGDDRISFLRNFLKDVSQFSSKSLWNRIGDFLNNRDDFRELYHDTSKSQVHRGWMTVLCLFLADIVLFYFVVLPQIEGISPGSTAELKKYYTLLSALIVLPFLVPLLSSLLTTQQSNKSVSTIDKFDELLEKFLKTLNGKKIVVFVDDLDRVTPEVARNVLDNMRIFFDKPQITFVVTGDHTVLERYIGSLTLPSSTPETQLEEGRRYLKKIFNLYWRLPLPLDSEFDGFLQELFTKHDNELKEIFKRESDRKEFSQYLKRYFDKNFRHVIRFFDTVLFTFDIVKGQHDDAKKEIKKYYKQMLENPLLVVRILMIQELCMPLFDAITKDTGELRNLEYLVEKKNSEGIEKKLKEYGAFTPGQLIFIRKFLYEEPRFFKNRILDVYAFEPFLYLAADANLGDARGLTKEDFTAILETGDPDQVSNSLENSGEEKANEAATATTELLSRVTEPPVDPNINAGHIGTIAVALTKIPDHFSQNYFITEMKSVDYSKIFSGAQVTNRIQISQEFWLWLDTQNTNDVKAYTDFFPLVDTGDLAKIDFSSAPLGHFSSRVICKWLRDYYASNKELILTNMETMLPQLDKKIVDEEFSTTIDVFTEDVLIWGTEEQREKLYQVLMSNISSARESLKKIVFAKIKIQDEAAWQWAYQKVNDSHKPWLLEELELQITLALDTVTDSNQLLSLIRFGGNKIVRGVETMWEKIGKNHADKVNEIIAQLAEDSFLTFSPPEKMAKLFYETTLQKIESGDDTQKIALLPSLQKKWLFTNISNIPGYQRVKKIGDSQSPDVIRETNSMLQSWGKPLIETSQPQ